MHPVFYKRTVVYVVIGVDSAGRDEKPLTGAGNVGFPVDGNRTFSVNDKIEFILVKLVYIAFPREVRCTQKSSAGIAYRIQIGKVKLLQAFHTAP